MSLLGLPLAFSSFCKPILKSGSGAPKACDKKRVITLLHHHYFFVCWTSLILQLQITISVCKAKAYFRGEGLYQSGEWRRNSSSSFSFKRPAWAPTFCTTLIELIGA